MKRPSGSAVKRLLDFGAVVAGCAIGVGAFYYPAARDLRALHDVDCRTAFDALAAKEAAAKDPFFASPATCTVAVVQPMDSPLRVVEFDFGQNIATYHFNSNVRRVYSIHKLSPVDTVIAKQAAERLPFECTMQTHFAAVP